MSIRYIIIIIILGCIMNMWMLHLVESTVFFPEIRYGVFKKNYTFSGMVANDGLLSKMDISSRRRCGDLCLSHSMCTAFFHNFEVGSCQLHNGSFRNVAPTPSPGTLLYELVVNRNETSVETGVSCASAGFQMVSTYCIKIVTTSVTALAAKQACPNLYPGSALVKITSSAKQNIIENELNAVGGLEIVYIQANRHYEGVTLKWLYDDGSELVYSNWNTMMGQPNFASSELYVGMRNSQSWRWHDFPDSTSFTGAYICELEIN